jgi:tetratricopeptide (TPR) repeat protein
MSARLSLAASALCAAILAVAAPSLCAAEPGEGSFVIDLSAETPIRRVVPTLVHAAEPKKPEPLAATPAEAPKPVRIIRGNAEGPDDSALRYYAALHQDERVNIETNRLRRLYPDWRVPEDLDSATLSDDPEEEVLWELFASDRLDDLQVVINQRMRQNPRWRPSKDLTTKLKYKTLRRQIMTYWKSGRWQDLIAASRDDSIPGIETDPEILWSISEAYARTKAFPEALNVLKTMLAHNGAPDVRRATILRAIATLRMMDVEALLATARTTQDGRSEFASIALDITRARISAFLHDEPVNEISDAEMRAFEDYARSADDFNQGGLVAWYYYKRKQPRDALEWFKLALQRGGDAMVAHGLAHSLRQLGMKRETEEVAYAWREPLVNNAILFIDILEADLTKPDPPLIEPERLSRYARVTLDTASGEGAQALAWYAYNSCQLPVALEWFQYAVAWMPKEQTVYGYALTLKKLKKTKEFAEIVNRYDGLFPMVIGLLFPDDAYHPPTPCDLRLDPSLAKQVASAPFDGRASGVPPSIRYGTYPVAYGGVPRPVNQATIPLPQSAVSPLQRVKIDPKEFPISVTAENPLRYGLPGIPRSDTRPSLALPQASISPLIQEPPLATPLVARRVTGVGPMPYERYGFALLPGWNGKAAATWPPYSAQSAPAGTLWNDELRTSGPVVAVQTASPQAPQTSPSSAQNYWNR